MNIDERLEEIKKVIDSQTESVRKLGVNDVKWLVSTVEEQQVENGRLKGENNKLAGIYGMWIQVSNRLEKLHEENARLREEAGRLNTGITLLREFNKSLQDTLKETKCENCGHNH